MPRFAHIVAQLAVAALALLPVEAGPLGFEGAALADPPQTILQCVPCSFIAPLESPPVAPDPGDAGIIIAEMGILAAVGFAGLKWRVRWRGYR